MRTQALLRLFLVAFGFAGFPAMPGCSRDAGVDEGPEINKKPISEEDPEAPRPVVNFPPHLRQQDPTLNAFIEKVLTICSVGDYDAFRQLFGTAYQPTDEKQFRQVWYNVGSVDVMLVQAGRQKEPHYYVLAKVRLRTPRNGRQERSVPVMVFKEADEWRVGPPPKAAIEELRALETQPASAPANAPASRPA